MKRRSFFKALAGLYGVAVFVPEVLGKVVEKISKPPEIDITEIMSQGASDVLDDYPDLHYSYRWVLKDGREITIQDLQREANVERSKALEALPEFPEKLFEDSVFDANQRIYGPPTIFDNEHYGVVSISGWKEYPTPEDMKCNG